ncbi:MAG TPA: TlpA disulfide reductase family protein [Pyrinomonadaceae bacterium]|nr:TlpA disulfide reductase family protein [Pyrinomonadaceae bacterium]
MKRVFAIALLLLSSMCGLAQSWQKVELELRDINGRALKLADYKGKVLLINFWATWCAPCRSEIPELIKLQSKYRDQGLQIVGITYPPEELSEVQRYVKNAKVNYPIAIGTKATKALFTTSETLPISVVFDPDGNVKHIIEGILYTDEFDEKVKPLLIKQ